MAVQDQATLLADISNKVPDNEAGEVEPADIRVPLLNVVETLFSLMVARMKRQSPWDPTGGTFPANALNGFFYRVTIGGGGTAVVDGVTFYDGDFIVATVDDASTAEMEANWELLKAGPGRYATAAQGTLADSAIQQAQLDAAINALVGGAPAALDTLNELAAALNDNENFATTVTNLLALKVGNDVSDLPGMTGVTRHVICTQAEYDARTPPADDATIIYEIEAA